LLLEDVFLFEKELNSVSSLFTDTVPEELDSSLETLIDWRKQDYLKIHLDYNKIRILNFLIFCP